MKLGHRHSKGDGDHVAGFDHDPHLARRRFPSFARAIDVPAATHQHMREENESAGKVHQHPFAVRLDLFHVSPGDGRVFLYATKLGKRSFKARDDFSCECAVERARRTIDGIALGHLGSPPTFTGIRLGFAGTFGGVIVAFFFLRG